MSAFPPSSSHAAIVDGAPDFVIAGVARAGTTSLANWLNQHPQLHLSPVKETNFFSRPELGTAGPLDHLLDVPPEYDTDGALQPMHVARIESWELYRRCLAPTKPGVLRRGEASVSYAFYPDAAARLHAVNPRTKVIFVLRNPVMRAVSNYLLFLKLEAESLAFGPALQSEAGRLAQGFQFCWAYAGLSRYRSALANFLAHFPAEQIHLARFEDLVEARRETEWRELLQFLGVDPDFDPERVHFNDTKDLMDEIVFEEATLRALEQELAPEIAFYQEIFASTAHRQAALAALAMTQG